MAENQHSPPPSALTDLQDMSPGAPSPNKLPPW